MVISAAGLSLQTPHFSALPPLALYVHIPWCLKKCPYCDFNSHERRGEIPEARYVDALLTDLELALPSIWGRRVHTVFFGGGTPSLFAPESIDRILAGVRARVALAPDAEITLEANPGTFERATLCRLQGGRHRPAIGRRAELRARDSCMRWGACTTPAKRAPRPRPRSRFSATSIST